MPNTPGSPKPTFLPPGETAAKPPYPANTLHAPLTSAQHSRVVTWLLAKGYMLADLEVGDDAMLIVQYNAVVLGGGLGKAPVITQNPSWLQSPLDFLKLLTNPAIWLRVAEVALGMLLVAAGLAKMSQRAAVVIRQVPIAGKALT